MSRSLDPGRFSSVAICGIKRFLELAFILEVGGDACAAEGVFAHFEGDPDHWKISPFFGKPATLALTT